MSAYFPPSENTPTFDSTLFRETNDNVITQADGDRLYLSRNGTASSLATSTFFSGTVSCGGNLTLNAPLAANRQIESSYLKLVDNASVSINKPYIWYPDPSLQITTNDFISGTLRTIDLMSYDGTGTGTYAQFSCQYNRVTAQGNIRLTRLNDMSKFSTISMDATNFTIANSVASGNILLNTTAGAIVANTPIVPSDTAPAVFLTRPSIGYSYFGSESAIAITATTPINVLSTISIPIGTWMFEASVLVAKSTSTFATVNPLSSTRLSYVNASGLAFVGTSNLFETMFANDQFSGTVPCGVKGGTRVLTITTAQQIPLLFQANWATLAGTPTYSICWSVIRIA